MNTKTLFVGNLPYSATTEQFLAHFSKFGSSNARIIEGRGFGFVDVESDKMTEAIDATNMKDFYGRQIAVNEAQPKTQGGRRDSTPYYGGNSDRRTHSGGSRSNRW